MGTSERDSGRKRRKRKKTDEDVPKKRRKKGSKKSSKKKKGGRVRADGRRVRGPDKKKRKSPKKEAAPTPPRLETCGEYGGRKRNGEPCNRPAGKGVPGRKVGTCSRHLIMHLQTPSGEVIQVGDQLSRAVSGLTRTQKAFVTALSYTGVLTTAAEMSEVPRSNHNYWLRKSVQYAEAIEVAKEIAADRVEAEVRRRGVHGTLEPVGWFRGQPGGYVRKYSDTLLIFLAKKVRPEFRDKIEVGGMGGGPLELKKTSDEELVASATMLAAKIADLVDDSTNNEDE